jgi:hypothetical protein
MYSFNQLQQEISAKIESLMSKNDAVLNPAWIAQAVMQDHPDVFGSDADFYTCCARLSVRKEVTQQLNKTEASDKNQLALDGFENLQQYYIVDRAGERVSVRIDRLTDAELDQKCLEYKAMGKTCIKHARDLQRYKESRSQINLSLAS